MFRVQRLTGFLRAFPLKVDIDVKCGTGHAGVTECFRLLFVPTASMSLLADGSISSLLALGEIR